MMKTVELIIILWGNINNDGSINVIKNGRNLNSIKYIEFLKEYFIPNLNDSDIFQHGRDLYHQDPITQRHLTDEDVNVLKQLPPNIHKKEHNKKVPNFIKTVLTSKCYYQTKGIFYYLL